MVVVGHSRSLSAVRLHSRMRSATISLLAIRARKSSTNERGFSAPTPRSRLTTRRSSPELGRWRRNGEPHAGRRVAPVMQPAGAFDGDADRDGRNECRESKGGCSCVHCTVFGGPSGCRAYRYRICEFKCQPAYIGRRNWCLYFEYCDRHTARLVGAVCATREAPGGQFLSPVVSVFWVPVRSRNGVGRWLYREFRTSYGTDCVFAHDLGCAGLYRKGVGEALICSVEAIECPI
jgi:hypothetical protein